MKNKIKFYLSLLFLGIGTLFTIAPIFLYWFIHGNYERYLWIIQGPYPFSNFGSGPFQLVMYLGLFLLGIVILIFSFNYLNKKYLNTKINLFNKKILIKTIVFVLIIVAVFFIYNYLSSLNGYVLNSEEIPRPANWQEHRISSNHLVFLPNSEKTLIGKYHIYSEHMSIKKVEYNQSAEQWAQKNIDLDSSLVSNFKWENKNNLKVLRVDHNAITGDGNKLTYYIFSEKYIYIFSYYPYKQYDKSNNDSVLFLKIVNDQINTLGSDSKLETETYTNDEHGISFEYPDNWRIEEWTDDRFGIGVLKGDTLPNSRMLVSIGTQNRIQTQEDLYQSNEVNRNDITEDLTISEKPATLVQSVSHDGSEIMYLKMFIFSDDNTYTITLTNENKYFEDFKEVFETIYKSFKVLGSEFKTDRYTIKNNNIYFITKNGEEELIENANPNTFKVLWESVYEGCRKGTYSKDTTNVFWKSKLVEEADTDTFESLLNEYGKDKNNVYLNGEVQNNLDPDTFQPECNYG